MKRGFTLVEVVVSLGLLVLALSMFLGTFVQARRSAATADRRLAAVHSARMAMETLLAYPYAAPQLSVGAKTVVVSGVTHFYTVVIVTQSPGLVVKNIFLTNYAVNPLTRLTSAVSLAGSMSAEFHP